MITKRDITISKLLKEPKLIDVVCTVTTAKGETTAEKATILKNKINKLQGNGLTSRHLYDLAKLGRCEVTDTFGTTTVYETKPHVKKSRVVESETKAEQEEAPPQTTEVSSD